MSRKTYKGLNLTFKNAMVFTFCKKKQKNKKEENKKNNSINLNENLRNFLTGTLNDAGHFGHRCGFSSA